MPTEVDADSGFTKSAVMAGLVPAIHAFKPIAAIKTWMPGTRPGMTKPEQERRQQCP
jgi:hypothetical protein